MKYKVGDIVTVRSDIKANDATIVEKMEKYKGKKVTIVKVEYGIYLISEDNGDWTWTDEMFEPTIAINKWKDLGGVTNDRFEISVGVNELYIFELLSNTPCVSSIIIKDKKVMLMWLNAFGFNVELEKKPTLTKREMEVVKALRVLGEKKIRRTYYNCLVAVNGTGRDNYTTPTIQTLFAFIEIDESLDLKELEKWEVE